MLTKKEKKRIKTLEYSSFAPSCFVVVLCDRQTSSGYELLVAKFSERRIFIFTYICIAENELCRVRYSTFFPTALQFGIHFVFGMIGW